MARDAGLRLGLEGPVRADARSDRFIEEVRATAGVGIVGQLARPGTRGQVAIHAARGQRLSDAAHDDRPANVDLALRMLAEWAREVFLMTEESR